jgi:hypothetical protein
MSGDGDWARGVDLEAPSAARMYDYYLGGCHNFAADRVAAEQVLRAIPNLREVVAANRRFLRNAVLHLLDLGITQFLDVGSGIPTVGNVHEIVHAVRPEARVVYVDLDPVAIVHARNLLADDPQATAIVADLRHPDAILGHREVRETLDLSRPVGLLMVSMLHFVPDTDAYPAVEALREALVPGSALAITHVATEGVALHDSDAVHEVYEHSTAPGGTIRSRAEIARFFGDYRLVPPGLVWVSQWQPGEPADGGDHPEQIALLAGVARRPA